MLAWRLGFGLPVGSKHRQALSPGRLLLAVRAAGWIDLVLAGKGHRTPPAARRFPDV